MSLRIAWLIGALLMSAESAQPSPKIYWTDYAEGKIRRANLDGSAAEDVLVRTYDSKTQEETGPILPHALALDTVAEHIYWTEASPFAPRRIRRSDMDGQNIVDLIIDLANPTSIELDVAAGKMYFVDAGVIFRSNLNGSAIEPVVDDLAAYDIELHLAEEKLYLVGGLGTWRVGLDGSSAEYLGENGHDAIYGAGIELDVQQGKMYVLDSEWSNGLIRRANLDGSNQEIVTQTGVGGVVGLAYNAEIGQIYWGQGNLFQGFSLYRICEEGANFEFIAFNTIGTIYGIAIDHRNANATGDGCAMDLRDWASFQRCFRPSPDLPGLTTSQVPCLTFDFDADRQSIGLNDFHSFLAYFAGPQ